MSATEVSPQAVHIGAPPDRAADRYDAVAQYSMRQVLEIWAAAAIPMGVLAWLVAPWLADQIGGRYPRDLPIAVLGPVI
jgi:hypothetical protein